MSYLYNLLGGGAGAASIMVAFIALVGAAAGALASYLVAGRAVYVNTITVERSKWIGALRQNIANYSTAVAQAGLRLAEYNHATDEEGAARRVFDKLDEINQHASLIQLQLNPWGEIDKNILKLINSVVLRVDGSAGLLVRLDELLIAHSQWLLKAEWEKVKYEAGGPLYRLIHEADERSRLAKYRQWASEEGAIEQLVNDLAVERDRDESDTGAT